MEGSGVGFELPVGDQAKRGAGRFSWLCEWLTS